MKKIVVKYSKLSVELKKAVRQKIEDDDVKFFNFPYQGAIEEGFLMEGLTVEGELVNYLVILDTEKKTKYKPTEDEEEDDDFDDEVDAEDLKGVVEDEDEFKDEEIDEIDDFDDFDDKDDDDDIADDEDFDDDEK